MYQFFHLINFYSFSPVPAAPLFSVHGAKFALGVSGLERVDWPLLQARDFSRDPNDPGKIERYQAEVLVHRHLPVSALDGIVCRGPSEQTELERLVTGMESDVDVASKPDWYFS